MTHKDLAHTVNDLYKNQGLWDFRHQETQLNSIFWGVRVYKDCIVVVFRGSITLMDWLRDGEATLVKSPLGLIHWGFWKNIPDVFTDFLALKLNPALPVVVVGHSLGAARARAFSAWMNYEREYNFKSHACITWGEPRLGIKLINNYDPAVSYTYINTSGIIEDHVTELPILYQRFKTTEIKLPVPFELKGIFEWSVLHSMDLYEKGTPETELPNGSA